MNLELPDLSAPGKGLQQVLRELAGEIRTLLHEPEAKTTAQIHDIRVDAKKLRSLLKLAGSSVDSAVREEAIVLVREIKESFGATRDDEVMRAALADLRPDLPPLQLGIPEPSPAASETPKPILAAADRLCELMAQLDLEKLSEKDALKNWLRTYRTARKVGKSCAKDKDDVLWHTWRKRIKDVFYQATALSGVARLKKLLEPLEALADRLGTNHDLAVLHERVAKVRPNSDAEKTLLKKKKKIMREAQSIAAKCLDKKVSAMRGKLR